MEKQHWKVTVLHWNTFLHKRATLTCNRRVPRPWIQKCTGKLSATRWRGLASSKEAPVICTRTFNLLRLQSLQFSVWQNNNVRALSRLVLCTPGVSSKIGQEAQKQIAPTRLSNAHSSLPTASKDEPVESRKVQPLKERVNPKSFQGRLLLRLQEGWEHVTADETRVLGLIRDETETNVKDVKDPGETQGKHHWLSLACQDESFN